jgi:hypothetical protein
LGAKDKTPRDRAVTMRALVVRESLPGNIFALSSVNWDRIAFERGLKIGRGYNVSRETR